MISEEESSAWREPREVGIFRASELGNCPRRIQYSMRGFEQAAIEPSLAMLFRDGNLHHDSVRNDLMKIGKLTNREQVFRKKYNVEGIEFAINGHMDGLFNGDFIIDIKGINRFSFQAIAKVQNDWKKVRDYLDNSPFSRSNYPQLQTYMDGFDKEWGCLLFKCKDTSELMEVWFPRDREYFQKLLVQLANIARITHEKKWIKRPYLRTSKECSYCPMKHHCWKVGKETP